jgi:hypothetical protein
LADILETLGLALLGVGILNVFFKVWQAQNRKLNFRDDHLFGNLKVVRWIKSKYRSLRPQPYEHDPVDFHEPLLQSIMECPSLPKLELEKALERRKDTDGSTRSLSVVCRVATFTEADQILKELALCFLGQGCWVQYTTCARHPIEFILQLERTWRDRSEKRAWKEVASHIVTVDAYSPHFGFTDSIHDESTKRLDRLGIKGITAKASYAGMHTAAAQAFNTIKKTSKAQGGQDVRHPTLLIYEGPQALVELESAEQYRIFIRHLIPSERLWGGMLTLVVESLISEQDRALLQMYADLFIDLADDAQHDRLPMSSGEAHFTQTAQTGSTSQTRER